MVWSFTSQKWPLSKQISMNLVYIRMIFLFFWRLSLSLLNYHCSTIFKHTQKGRRDRANLRHRMNTFFFRSFPSNECCTPRLIFGVHNGQVNNGYQNFTLFVVPCTSGGQKCIGDHTFTHKHYLWTNFVYDSHELIDQLTKVFIFLAFPIFLLFDLKFTGIHTF